MFNHIIYICLTHTTNSIGITIKLLFLFSKIFVQHTLYPCPTHHSKINCILRENIFQHQVADCIISFFNILNHFSKRNWRSCIKHHIKLYRRPIFLNSRYNLMLDFNQSYSLSNRINIKVSTNFHL